MTVLSTPRMTMSPVSIEDFDGLARLWRQEGLTRYITGRPLTDEEVWFRLLRDIGHWTSLGHGNWSLKLHNGTMIGSVGLFDYRRDLTPAFTDIEVGWVLGEDWHGQGLAREAVECALEYADEKLNLSRTVCMISAENLASIKLAEAVGFRFYADGHYKAGPIRLYERMRAKGVVTG